MTLDNKIPVVIGVSGHRRMHREDIPAIRAAVKSSLEKLIGQYPNTPFIMLTSLAEGADLLCADVAEDLGISVAAALPFELSEYEKDFDAENLQKFRHHYYRAEQTFVVPATEEPNGMTARDFLFRQAGIYVAVHSHFLLALWDGKPGQYGCGTADAVDFALNGSYMPKNNISVRSDSSQTVIHVVTPRGSGCESAGTVHILGNTAGAGKMFALTDRFNQKASKLPPSERKLLPTDRPAERILDRMENVYLAASRISKDAAKQFRRTIALFAAGGTVLTMAFLLYDEVGLRWMILVCGLMLLGALFLSVWAKNSDCHRRYIDCRALAESIRVQAYLRYAGSSIQAADLLSFAQREETGWIANALITLSVGPEPDTARDIRSCWVEAQRKYHYDSRWKSKSRITVRDRMVNTAMIVSILVYVSAVVYELFCGGLIFSPKASVTDTDVFRTVIKIVLGSVSAFTLFISAYFGKLSLPRRLSDHSKMENFFKKVSDSLDVFGQTDDLLSLLAREELIENGNWYSYQSDNKPEIIF